jgi:UDP-2,3-diacylglucosamine hydrolase
MSLPQRVAIIAGAGQYPRLLAASLRAKGVEPFIVALLGAGDAADFNGFDARAGGLGQLGGFVKDCETRNITDMVMLGALQRPQLKDIKPDFGWIRHLPALRRAFIGGDDHLLRGILRIFEEIGFRVWGPLDLAPELAAAAGTMSKQSPSSAARGDIAAGLAVLAALGPHDIGQAVVSADGRVVAVEGIEGTAGLLQRLAAMRANGRFRMAKGSGVLIKAAKPGQEMRVDLPAIGEQTLEDAAAAGLAGIAVAAGQVLIGDRAAMTAQANRLGLFLEGVRV